jgi:lipopolysaccharide export system permease protein
MVAGSVLNRMIFTELVKVFLLALVSLTALFLMAGLVQQAAQLGLSPTQVVAAIPLFVPSTLPYTIPATTLFASCVVYGRLAHDNEVIAIRAAGVHLFTILKPALLLGVLTTAVTAGLYHTVIPATQQMLQKQILNEPEEFLYNLLRRDRCFRHPTFPYVLFVKDVQGKRLVDVVIKRRAVVETKGGQPRDKDAPKVTFGYDLVARAREARLRVDMDEGRVYIDPDRFVFTDKDAEGDKAAEGGVGSSRPFAVPLPDFLHGKDAKSRPGSLTWDELRPRAAELAAERQTLEGRRAADQERALRATDLAERKEIEAQDQHYRAKIDQVQRLARNVDAEFWMRPALAAGCLVFALIGCPVGIWANRADYLSTFVVCFLPTVFVYYPLLLAGSNMGKDGKLPMPLGCWLANITVGAAGLVLTWRLLRR